MATSSMIEFQQSVFMAALVQKTPDEDTLNGKLKAFIFQQMDGVLCEVFLTCQDPAVQPVKDLPKKIAIYRQGH